ncbi:MAG: response regulator [Candidatus Nomurabacteria bacterium]|jgi:CheY-like chemotaxis protein|nr:response regulator [Candidatus Nomurabacteria bacterium]
MSYILIIDSDKWYSQSLANMLENRSVVVVGGPEEAMAEIEKNIPYMIYLDLNLGTRNGLTLLNELQSWTDTKTLPVVLLTPEAKRLNIKDWRQYGVAAILDKTGLTPDILRESLRYGEP